ncbi:MAG: BON domain-containing protein [Planctomycetia bacterium]|nr:BON domain-containing protein [Planctomycetia bacterium]
MRISDDPELVPAPNQFAAGDVAEGHDIKWRIMACFRCRIPEVQGIHVTVFGNTAVLRGKVRSLHDRRLCLECCRHVPGVMRVVDELTSTEQ